MATLSLVRKDLAAARPLMWLVIPLGIVQLSVLALTPQLYLLAALTFAALLAFGSIAVEETQRTELLWNSLPVSRSQFVTARYLTTLLGIVVGLIFGLGLAQLVTRLAGGTVDGSTTLLGFGAHVLLFGFLVLAAAVFLPLYFRLGAGRAVLLFSAISLAALVTVSLLTSAILSAKGYPSPVSQPEAWRAAAPALIAQLSAWIEPRVTLLLGSFASGAVLVAGVSLLVSRSLYEGRDL